MTMPINGRSLCLCVPVAAGAATAVDALAADGSATEAETGVGSGWTKQ